MSFDPILKKVSKYYTERVKLYGATAHGVDWNSEESQQLRFSQLIKILSAENTFSINDFGCGYGALVDYLDQQGYTYQYFGFDISKKMITQAQKLHKKKSHCRFSTLESDVPTSDFTVASGIFNVKLDTDNLEWEVYILHTLKRMDALSQKGFAFNILSSYSDPDKRSPNLYYSDPSFLFDLCKKHFSKYVSLLHDYPLYEFTVLVKYKGE
jgi:SAM-dependent methyltransferase